MKSFFGLAFPTIVMKCTTRSVIFPNVMSTENFLTICLIIDYGSPFLPIIYMG